MREKLRKLKYPLLGVLAAGSIGSAFLAGTSCSGKNSEQEHNTSSYEQALDRYAECESYLLDESFAKANECNESLASIVLESDENKGRISRLSNGFNERMQDSIENKYNLLLKQAEAELELKHYDYALQLTDRIEREVERLDFFGEKQDFISKANELERKINDEKQKPEEVPSYIAQYYNRIKQIYLALGFGQPLSDIAAALTILLPAYGLVRRFRKRFS